MVGTFVLTNLLYEVIKLEKWQQDLSTTTLLWESTFVTEENPRTAERKDREQDLKVISSILGDVRELSNDLTTYVHDIKEENLQKKDRCRADNFETELLLNTSNQTANT